MTEVKNLSRRDLFRSVMGLSGGLLLGVYLPGFSRLRKSAPSEKSSVFAPNAFMHVGSNDSVTLVLGKTELGQGVHTSLPMLIAEELEVDLDKIRLEVAPVAPPYFHPFFGMQMTGGSTSVMTSWEPLRRAGAVARTMLLTAAAETWRIDPSSCHAKHGVVTGESPQQRITYGQLVEKASHMTTPKDVKLKEPRDFTLIGRPTRRLDNREKVDGRAQFGIDVRPPGTFTAVIARSPIFGGKVKSCNADKAKAVAGVKAVVEIGNGVAVVADGFWPAVQARKLLEVTWEDGSLAQFDTSAQQTQFAELATRPGLVAKEEGIVAAGFGSAAKKVEAAYELPYLAHATMEPLNCVADVRSDECEIWVGTQFQTLDRNAAASAAGLAPERVTLHTMPAGGGFGRRGAPDGHFVREAVQVSKAVRAPVKVIWTREDDIQGGYYRPAYYHALQAGLDSAGSPSAWSHRIVGQSVLSDSPFESRYVKNGIDVDSVGGAVELPYEIPNLFVDVHTTRDGPRVWAWRSVGSSHNAFVVESFVDELAHAAGKDPYEYRHSLLAKQPRYRAVLELAAERAGWSRKRADGHGLGIAIHRFSSIVAQVAEVSAGVNGEFRVHRVVCAVDCGTVINPESVRAQMEGGIVFGLSAALYGEITLKNGRVQQSNFHDYPLLRIDRMPAVEVHMVPGTGPPSGIGEAGVPPIAPAVTNAIFAASGKRIRRLPIRGGGSGSLNDISPISA
jgi:isoquinoline 1-oxidoreductase subunit beta